MYKTICTTGEKEITKKSGLLKLALENGKEVIVEYEFDDALEEVIFRYDSEFEDEFTMNDFKSMREYITKVIWKVIDGTWTEDTILVTPKYKEV